MKPAQPLHEAPADAGARRAVAPVICYPPDTLPTPDMTRYRAARDGMVQVDAVMVPPRDTACFKMRGRVRYSASRALTGRRSAT